VIAPKFVIYTDGACTPNPGVGGWAAILQYTNAHGKVLSKRISGGVQHTTNNHMEIMAVLAALRKLRYASDVTIYSDSSYVVRAIGDWAGGRPVRARRGWMVKWQQHGWHRSASNKKLMHKDLWQELYYLASLQSSVAMRWIRGHSGNKFNELCDALAVEARIKVANGILEART
jgi:ribonuclease HI